MIPLTTRCFNTSCHRYDSSESGCKDHSTFAVDLCPNYRTETAEATIARLEQENRRLREALFNYISKKIIIVVNYPEPFLCGVNGAIPLLALNDIERRLQTDPPSWMNKAGDYVCEVTRNEAQKGEHGQTEIAEYYDVSLLRFSPSEEDQYDE